MTRPLAIPPRAPATKVATKGDKGSLSDRAAAHDHAEEHHYDGDDEEQVDEAAHRGRGDEAEGPEHHQDRCDRPEHGRPNLSARARSAARSRRSRRRS